MSDMFSFLFRTIQIPVSGIRLFLFSVVIFIAGPMDYLQSQNISDWEKIAGAFGFRFNQTFNPDNALSVVYDSNNAPLYLIDPIIPNSLFSEYFITLSPDTNRVSSIYARSMKQDMASCVVEKDKLINSLSARYGEVMSFGNEEIQSGKSANQKYIFQGRRFIISDCQTIQSNPYLIIYYADGDLLEMVESQRSMMGMGEEPGRAVRQPEVDTSGL